MGAMAQDALEPDAFKKLYPDQYYARFVAEGLRPDGRPLARARPTTIALGAVSTADSSALVKIGSTTVMAGIKLEARAPACRTPQRQAPSLCHSRCVAFFFSEQACRHGSPACTCAYRKGPTAGSQAACTRHAFPTGSGLC
jgi:hypothetical protein